MAEQNEQPKLRTDEAEFPSDRVAFYEGKAREILNAHSREFHEFIKGHEDLEAEGDKIICLGEGTGYNIILTDQDMPLTSSRDLIFYNNCIGRPHHFGMLLASMEARGIITPDIVRFGKKATKVLFDGSWTLNPNDEFEETISYVENGGVVHDRTVNRTVETVAIFSPKNKTQAVKVADYLLERADASKGGAVDGSWEVPDIRATVSLRSALIMPELDFVSVISNIFEKNGSSLIILRQKKKFEQKVEANEKQNPKWRSRETTQNRKLAEYLVNREFGVSP